MSKAARTLLLQRKCIPIWARVTDVPPSEALALVHFYNATDGDNWTDNTNWLTDTTVGNWYGITVADGHVTEIDLHGEGAEMFVESESFLAATLATVWAFIARTFRIKSRRRSNGR